MKKQSGLQIVLSAAVASGQLALGLSAFAEEAQLRPATETVVLQPVPATQTTVLPVVYLPFADSLGQNAQQTTTVNAELQKLVQQTANASAAGQNTREGGQIQLVQMSEDGEANSRSEAAASKKPGFFKRLFGGSRTKQIPGVGEPAPPIPKPPAITYETNGSRRNQTKGNSRVPTSAVSFGDAKSNATNVATTGTHNGYQNQKPGTGGNFFQAPGNGPTQDSGGFINPFESQGTTLEEETLLDLDSLIEETSVAVVPSNRTVAQPSVDRAENPFEMELSSSAQEKLTETPDGPYTGYRLDVNNQAVRQTDAQSTVDSVVEAEQPLPRVVSQQQVRSEVVDSRVESVRKLPIVESLPEVRVLAEVAEPEQLEADEIPLLEEPEMALPVAQALPQTPQQQQQLQIQSIPLLEEESVSIPALTEEQPVIQEGPAKPLPPVQSFEEPSLEEPVREQPVPATRMAAERLANLEQQARRDQQAYRIMSRTGQTGFKGFCPVELRDGRQLVNSRPEYKAKFGLQTYYFSSPECKSAFEADPARYAPAVGGSDIVLLVNTNEEISGNLEFSLWYRDRLYLFRSRETRRIFADNPVRFADQY